MRALRLYAAVADDARAPIPVAIITPRTMQELRIDSGMRVIAVRGRLRVAVWIRSTEEVPQKARPDRDRDEMVWLSRRALALLHVEDEEAPLVELQAPDVVSFAIGPALVDDLPRASEVDVARDQLRRFGAWALAYSGGISIPIRLRARPRVPDGMLRLSRLTRTLARVDDDQPRLRISPFERERLHWRDDLRGRTSLSGWAGVLVASLRRTLRYGAWLVEFVLRILFQAPALPMTTVEAQLGDDSNRVVRIPAETFDILGIKPGDDLFIEWADRRVIAVAHTSFDAAANDPPAPATVDTWGTETPVSPAARHLIIGLGAEMRGELRIPRRTIVTVRRRVTSIFARRMNELTLPVGGLLLAAVAIKDFPLWGVVLGTVAVTILAMLPARYRVPPRGRWP